MCAMKYYEPSDKNQYKELRKNWKKEIKRPKPEFENHLNEYETNSSNQESLSTMNRNGRTNTKKP